MSSPKTLAVKVVGIGAWGDGFESWQELQDLLVGKAEPKEGLKGPKPAVIPANERRRAPLPVRLAVEVSSQAVDAANMDPKDLACVFASGFGDTQLTDYMCQVLASDNKQLSPTKFHNSVHNAAAGYWTISTGCQLAANSVAGFDKTAPLTLLEAVSQCEMEQVPILMTLFDAPVTPIMRSTLGEGTSFALSLAIVPLSTEVEAPVLSIAVKSGSVEWPEFSSDTTLLKQHYVQNPCARLLPLLSALSEGNNFVTAQPLSDELSLAITLESAKS